MIYDNDHKSDWNVPDGSSYMDAWLEEKEAEADDKYFVTEDSIEDYDFDFSEYYHNEDEYCVRVYNWKKDELIPGVCQITGSGKILYSDFPDWMNEIIIHELEYYAN